MIFSDIVSFVFRFINLFVLIYFFYYMFKKYIRSSLEEALAGQEAYDTGLHEQEQMLQARLQESRQERYEQEQECLTLQHKIERWQEQHDVALSKQQVALARLHKQLMQRTAKQRDELAQSILMRQALMQALPLVQQQLEKEYAHGRQAENFINHALSALTKE